MDPEAMFSLYATNNTQSNIEDLHVKSDMSLNLADTMLLQRLPDLAHVRQSQILQSQNDGWYMNTPSLGEQVLAETRGNNHPAMPTSSDRNDTAGKNERDYYDDEECGESDQGGAKDVKVEASDSIAQITDEENRGRAPPQQRPQAAVEKRYRRTVNTKLQQLYSSIPASGTFSPHEGSVTGSDESDQAAKPVVLDKAIQYVQHLTETYLKYDSDIEDLRRQLRHLASRRGITTEQVPQSQSDERASRTA